MEGVLSEQSEYIKNKYEYNMPEIQNIDIMNEQPWKFIGYMSDGLNLLYHHC